MTTPNPLPTGAIRAARGWPIVLAALLCLVPRGARAQDHRLSLTGYLGSAAYGSLTSEVDPGVTLESGGFYGGMVELWFGRFGARLHSGLGSTSADSSDATFDLAAADLDLVARLRRPRPGQFFQPYGVLGLGGIRYDLASDSSAVEGFAYDSNPVVKPTMVLGIGTDLGGGPVAARIELMDIIGLSSPLSRADGTAFGPVSHVVLILGLSLRTGTIDLPPEPERPRRPPVNRIRPTERPDTTRPPGDTATTDTVRLRRPRPPAIDTTVAPDTTAPRQEPPDTVRRLPPQPPDTTGVTPGPVVDTAGPPADTARPPVDTAGPIRRPPPLPGDTGRLRPVVDSGPRRLPPDSTRRLPPRGDTTPPIEPPNPPPPPADTGAGVDTVAPPPGEPVDTTGPPEPPTDTAGPPTDTVPPPQPPDTAQPPGPPTDTTDTGGGVRGRLFTVRVTWNPDDLESATAMLTLVDSLGQAAVPMWPPVADSEEMVSHRRLAALRNAADARVLGNYIADTYGLEWEWVLIDRDEDVSVEAVEASTAFVDMLKARGTGPGGRGGPAR